MTIETLPAFSIPIHEESAVVLDQIQNILRFNSGALIVLHVSKQFKDFDWSMFDCYPQVYINPKQYLTEHGKGLLYLHGRNFAFLEQLGLGFSHFCLLSSNELFIRSGLEHYIERTGAAFQAQPFSVDYDWHLFRRRIDQHPKLQKLLQRLTTAQIFGGQAEGQFFPRALFRTIFDYYLQNFGAEEIQDFETEEIIPQTIACALGYAEALPFTLVDYTHQFKLTQELITQLRDPYALPLQLKLGPKLPLCLHSPHLNQGVHSIYSVKRIARDLNDSLRSFLRAT